MLSRCYLDFSVGVGTFVIGLSQISFFISSGVYSFYSSHETVQLYLMIYTFK